jgi:hypothetical protein
MPALSSIANLGHAFDVDLPRCREGWLKVSEDDFKGPRPCKLVHAL